MIKRIVVLGAGISGVGAAVLAKQKGLMFLFQIKEQLRIKTK